MAIATKAPVSVVECVKCHKQVEVRGTLLLADELPTWRRIVRSNWKDRTHMAWCPECSKQYGVER